MSLNAEERRKGPEVKALETPIRTASPTLRQIFTEMKARKIFGKDMARRIQRHENAVSSWRSGARNPNIMDVEELAHELGYRLVLEPIEKGKKK